MHPHEGRFAGDIAFDDGHVILAGGEVAKGVGAKLAVLGGQDRLGHPPHQLFAAPAEFDQVGQSDDGQVFLAGHGEDLIQRGVLVLGVHHPAEDGHGGHAGLMSQIHGRFGESGAPQDAALGRPDGPNHARL